MNGEEIKNVFSKILKGIWKVEYDRQSLNSFGFGENVFAFFVS